MNGKTHFSWEVLSSHQQVYQIAWWGPEGDLVALEVVEAPTLGEAVARTATVMVSEVIRRQQ